MRSKDDDYVPEGIDVTSKANAQDWSGRLRSAMSSTNLSKEHMRASKPASALAWLDGYRGLAAIGVFNFHYFTVFTDSLMTGYGYNSDHRRFAELPFVRFLADGGTFVNVFFIVSGYVCSLNALKLLTSQNMDKAMRGLAASTFRRYFRLYLPVFAITLISAFSAQVGVFDIIRAMIEQKQKYFPGPFSEANLTHYPNAWDQLKFWASEMATLSSPWTFSPFYPIHDPHLWTIQFEFRMSMHLYLCLVGLSRCRPRIRMLLLCLIGTFHLLSNHWEGPLFFTGAALAQYDVIRSHETKTTPLPSYDNINCQNSSASRSSLHKFARSTAYFLAFYFMTYPIGGHKRPPPGYTWMTGLIPKWYNRKEKLPKTIGVVLLTYLLCTADPSNHNTQTPPTPAPLLLPPSPSSLSTTKTRPQLQPVQAQPLLHRVFLSRAAQFAGKNMFGLYLVHGPILHAFGYAIPHVIWGVIGQGSTVTYLVGLMVGWAVNLAVCLSAAVVFHRTIEPRCASMTRKLEALCFEP